MAWNSVGDFNTIAEDGVKTMCLATFGDYLYVGLSNGQIWRYDGVDWELSFSAADVEIAVLYVFENELYTMTSFPSTDNLTGIWRYDGLTDWEAEDFSVGSNTQAGDIIEFDGVLYATKGAMWWVPTALTVQFIEFWVRSGGGSWSQVTTNDWGTKLGIYQDNMYLSGLVNADGNLTDGTNYIRLWDGVDSFDSDIFTEGVGGSVEFWDTFTDINGTNLQDHTPNVGSGWINILNAMRVQTGHAELMTNDPSIVVTNAGEANITITALIEVDNTNTNQQGIVARVEGINDMWFFVYAFDPGNLYIIERSAGVDTVRASSNLALASGSAYQFRVELFGDNMDFWIVGGDTGGQPLTAKISYNSSTLNDETLHGIVIGENLDTEIDNVRMISGTQNTWHSPMEQLLEFGTHLYAYHGRYMHRWDSATWTLNHTFDDDELSRFGRRGMIEYDNKVWVGNGISIWFYDGDWVEDADSDVGYSDDRFAAGNRYAPPLGFAIYDGNLYVCGGPGEVFVRVGAPTNNVRGIAIARSRALDDRLWLTAWRPNELFLRSYLVDTLEPAEEIILGAASQAQVNAGTVIAYPYIPPNSAAGTVVVFGRFAHEVAEEYKHIIMTLNAGDDWLDIETNWGTNVCGSVVMRGSRIYAIRNVGAFGYLYTGISNLTYVSTLSMPVRPYAFDISANGGVLFAGNKLAGEVPRVLAATSPFTNWVDITLNYPIGGAVTSIVSL